jgi:predicted dehydrogenase
MSKLRWGVLGAAKIALQKVIPALQQSQHCEVLGIASRSKAKAAAAAEQLGVSRSYGSYQELLDDAHIDVVYIPLPNHLHVPWSVAALQAGKHVLCEKPIALTAAEAETLVAESLCHPRLKIMEAFMYRGHPQWVAAKEMVDGGEIGQLTAISSLFSYFNRDPNNVRNQLEIGGGALMDIGCYPISLSRFMFGSEPKRVLGSVQRDPEWGIDRLTSGILEFDEGVSIFACGTQMTPYQRVQIFGDSGRIEIEIPFNAPPDRPCKLWRQQGNSTEEIILETADQYTIQGDRFSRAIINDTPVPTPLEDAVANMRVIEAVLASAVI